MGFTIFSCFSRSSTRALCPVLIDPQNLDEAENLIFLWWKTSDGKTEKAGRKELPPIPSERDFCGRVWQLLAPSTCLRSSSRPSPIHTSSKLRAAFLSNSLQPKSEFLLEIPQTRLSPVHSSFKPPSTVPHFGARLNLNQSFS